MRLATTLLALFIASTAVADSLSGLIAKARSAEYREYLKIDTSYDIPSRRAQEAVSRAVLASGNRDAVVAAVAKALSISPAAAAPLIEADLRQELAYDGISDEDRPAFDALLEAAAREAPQSKDVLAFCVAREQGEASNDDFAARWLPRVRALREPGDAAIVAEAVGGERGAIIAADALGRDPGNRPLQQALTNIDDGLLTTAFGPVRLAGGKASLREAWKARPAAEVAAAASRQIRALAGFGRAAEVLAVFDALPAEARTGVDVRLDLAAAALLSGDPDRARSLIANVHPRNRLLQALLAPKPPEDVYDLLAATINSESRPYGGIWSLVFADVAERGGYASVGTAALGRANRWVNDEIAKTALPYLPDELRDEVQEALDRSAASIAAIRDCAKSVGESSDAIRRRLAQARIGPFAEKGLPPKSAASGATAIDCSDAERVAKTMKIPAWWYPIRLERNGNEVAGIAISQALDPMGEVGRGAYWVLHSGDGGQTWDAPLYTGLRENAPYVVVPASTLALMHGDHLEVEVAIREIDPRSVTFPPVGMRTKRKASGLYLELPWDVLRRDSDGDGVTDLVEERLATDPQAADTDGDGIPDGKDGLPLVPLAAGRTAEAEVLAAVLRQFRPGAGALIVGLPNTEEERAACVVRASAVGEGAVFLIGDRSLFAPIDINRRLVVLSADEMLAYDGKFGATYGADVSFLIVRRDGRKALVVLNESWKEDVYELTRGEKGWTVKVVGGWIS